LLGARCIVALLLVLSSPALASGLQAHGSDLFPREKVEVTLDGYLRLRGEIFQN
jgi:hypothetical protein